MALFAMAAIIITERNYHIEWMETSFAQQVLCHQAAIHPAILPSIQPVSQPASHTTKEITIKLNDDDTAKSLINKQSRKPISIAL